MTQIVLMLAAVAAPLLGETEARFWADHFADAYGLQRELVCAVIEAESAWNPRAVSEAGAAGLMQLMPETAVALRVRNRFDVADNIGGGVAYLAWLMNYFGGDVRLAVASYNAGHGRILRAGLQYRSAEVHSYVSRVAALYRRNRRATLVQLGREDLR
jgi:soluble lytic murein transglycosylase-like protein